MASTSTGADTGMGGPMTSHPVLFKTQTPYPLPSQKYMIPSTWKRYQLSQLINKALSLPKPIPFDFLVRGEVLRSSLGEWCAEKGVGEEETLDIEYIESVMPPHRTSEFPHEDWVSSVSCQLQGYFLTASYDGCVRAFDYTQKLTTSIQAHSAPITSICIVPSTSSDQDSQVIASASHDLSAQLTRLTFSSNEFETTTQAKPLATLHLHTSPLSSITASSSGSHLLTSSWDGLIGLWSTSIPSSDEVPADQVQINDRKNKRRKVAAEDDSERPKRKAPVSVLKSHTARVSKVVFGLEEKVAYSCGFDSTVRTWDIELGVCTNTITSPEKPFLDLALTADGHTALAASTDRTITLYDLRSPSDTSTSLSAITGTLTHPATPSCIKVSPSGVGSVQQVVSGAYDGVVRIWDLRSTKGAVASFKAWEGKDVPGKKVLSVDWARGVVGVGGEAGFEVWRVGDGNVGS